VVQSGSHAELLQQEGAYARSWQMQMQAGNSARDA
jgi:ABC-type multidrug transport system fused ATPase/permease subunit